MTNSATTDARGRRIAVLAAAARAKSQAKTHAAERAIRALVKRGEPVTFQAVQREAGVSHAFLYTHPELRGRIEHLRAQARPARVVASGAAPDVESTLVQALTS
jgi:predicted Zn-dependent protease